MRDFQESVTTWQTDRQTDWQTDAGQSDPYVRLRFEGGTKTQYDNISVDCEFLQAFQIEHVERLLTLWIHTIV